MDQQSIRAFDGQIDPATGGWVELGCGQSRAVRSNRHEPDISTDRLGEADAHYCRSRAEVEAERAEQATHPAARRAHLELAELFHERALAALQVEDSAVQDWVSEGGSWLMDA